MNMWEHERVIASAHSSAHVNRLSMMQRELKSMEKKAAAFEKRSEAALREVGCNTLIPPPGLI